VKIGHHVLPGAVTGDCAGWRPPVAAPGGRYRWQRRVAAPGFCDDSSHYLQHHQSAPEATQSREGSSCQ
jgi:hypothetical protein